MSDTIKCTAHGDRSPAIVCSHIMQTLEDGQPRGFLWTIDEEGEYQAICPTCDNMSDAEWAAAFESAAVICIECFKLAAAYNGVKLDGMVIR